jgi:hypothetical protein
MTGDKDGYAEASTFTSVWHRNGIVLSESPQYVWLYSTLLLSHHLSFFHYNFDCFWFPVVEVSEYPTYDPAMVITNVSTLSVNHNGRIIRFRHELLVANSKYEVD